MHKLCHIAGETNTYDFINYFIIIMTINTREDCKACHWGIGNFSRKPPSSPLCLEKVGAYCHLLIGVENTAVCTEAGWWNLVTLPNAQTPLAHELEEC
jgi:hypothetical protein